MNMNRAAARKKAVRVRKRKLEKEHYDILNWLMCIEDNIVLGNDDEVKDFIKKISGYTEKLALLVGERQQRRLSKIHNHKVSST